MDSLAHQIDPLNRIRIIERRCRTCRFGGWHLTCVVERHRHRKGSRTNNTGSLFVVEHVIGGRMRDNDLWSKLSKQFDYDSYALCIENHFDISEPGTSVPGPKILCSSF